jgi:chromosome segregation ATPase
MQIDIAVAAQLLAAFVLALLTGGATWYFKYGRKLFTTGRENSQTLINLNRRLTDVEADLAAADERAAKANQESGRLKAEVERLKAEMTILKQEKDESNRRAEQNAAERAAAEKKLLQSAEELAAERKITADMERRVRELEDGIRKLENKIAAEKMAKDIIREIMPEMTNGIIAAIREAVHPTTEMSAVQPPALSN